MLLHIFLKILIKIWLHYFPSLCSLQSCSPLLSLKTMTYFSCKYNLLSLINTTCWVYVAWMNGFWDWLHDMDNQWREVALTSPLHVFSQQSFIVCSSLSRDGALDTSFFNVSMSAGGVEISWVRLSFHIYAADFLVLWVCEHCSPLLSDFPWALSIGIVCGCVVWGWTPQSVFVLCILTELRISCDALCSQKRLLWWGGVRAAPVWGVRMLRILDRDGCSWLKCQSETTDLSIFLFSFLWMWAFVSFYSEESIFGCMVVICTEFRFSETFPFSPFFRIYTRNEWLTFPSFICDGEWSGCLLVLCLLHGPNGKQRDSFLCSDWI